METESNFEESEATALLSWVGFSLVALVAASTALTYFL